jgi:hypothetical protein
MLETQDLGLIPEPILDEAQRPGARWETTAAPAVTEMSSADDGAITIALSSATAGASIGYRFKGDAGAGWRLYNGPVREKPGEALVAKAGRIGFRDSSPVERMKFASSAKAGVHGGDWRSSIIDRDVLQRLLALKEHDREPSQAIAVYERALADPHAALRYWGVVGLRVAGVDKAPSSAVKTALARLAEDDGSQVVRIVAAHALCRWGEQGKGLPILATGLENPQPAVQLYAAHALEEIGEPARPLLPRLKQLAAKSSEYVERVTASTVERLEGAK